MTNCIGDNTVVEFVEGSLTPTRAASVETHIATCEPCRLRVVALGASPSRLVEAPAAPVGIGAHLHLNPGARIDRFIVLNKLGHGGMGVVFAAFDPDLQRRVAVKLLRSGASVEKQFLQSSEDLRDEARIMASLHHPNIVAVHETGTFRGEAYLVMELVSGTTLGEWQRRWGPRPWTAILDAFTQAGRALAHAHAHGLAHGDFKPDNVLIDDSDRVRVTDFGLACPFERPIHEPATSSGTGHRDGERQAVVMGTPRYMAPEQYRGQSADALSDQFSFCVALFEALYGRHPCTHDNPRSILELPAGEIWTGIPRDTEVPAPIGRVLARGLHPRPSARYASMHELLAELLPHRNRGRTGKLAALASGLLCVAGLIGFLAGHRLASDSARAPIALSAPAEMAEMAEQPAIASARPDERSVSRTSRSAHQPIGAADMSAPAPAGPAASATDGSRGARDRGEARSVYLGAADAPVSLALVKQLHGFLRDELNATRSALAQAQRRLVGTGDASGRPERRVADSLQPSGPSPTGDRAGEPSNGGSGNGPSNGSLARPIPPEDQGAITSQISKIAEHVDELERIQTAQGARITQLERRKSSVKPAKPAGLARPGLSSAVVRRRIEARLGDLQVCFKEWRERHATGRGTLTVSLHIDRRGRARLVRYRGMADRVVRKCTAGALADIRFARAPRSSMVTVAFTSEPRSLRMSVRSRRGPR